MITTCTIWLLARGTVPPAVDDPLIACSSLWTAIFPSASFGESPGLQLTLTVRIFFCLGVLMLAYGAYCMWQERGIMAIWPIIGGILIIGAVLLLKHLCSMAQAPATSSPLRSVASAADRAVSMSARSALGPWHRLTLTPIVAGLGGLASTVSEFLRLTARGVGVGLPAAFGAAGTTQITLFMASAFSAGPRVHVMAPFLAQATPVDSIINNVLGLFAKIFFLIGIIIIAYGGYEIHQGRVREGLLAIVGGLVLSMAIPIMKWLFQLAGNPIQ